MTRYQGYFSDDPVEYMVCRLVDDFALWAGDLPDGWTIEQWMDDVKDKVVVKRVADEIALREARKLAATEKAMAEQKKAAERRAARLAKAAMPKPERPVIVTKKSLIDQALEAQKEAGII